MDQPACHRLLVHQKDWGGINKLVVAVPLPWGAVERTLDSSVNLPCSINTNQCPSGRRQHPSNRRSISTLYIRPPAPCRTNQHLGTRWSAPCNWNRHPRGMLDRVLVSFELGAALEQGTYKHGSRPAVDQACCAVPTGLPHFLWEKECAGTGQYIRPA
jgi:hypothetical protein